MKNRILSILLCLIVLVSGNMSFLQIKASATGTYNRITSARGSDYTSSSHMAGLLDQIFNGNASIYSDSNCTKLVNVALGKSTVPNNGVLQYVGPYGGPRKNAGTSCAVYAKGVYYTLFGECPQSGYELSSDRTELLTAAKGNKITYDNFIKWGVRQGVGAHVRVGNHSIIVLGYTDLLLTFVEGNGDGKGHIRIIEVSWNNISSQNRLKGDIVGIFQPKDDWYRNEFWGSSSPTPSPFISISNETMPSGDRTQGRGFSLEGVISSYPNLTNVTAQIIDTNSGSVVNGFNYSTNPNSASYNIKTGGADAALKFGNLDVGNYRYLVKATNSAIGTKTLIDSTFTVGGGHSVTYGSTMSSGAGRTIPDGNYIIANASDTSYYLDIDGSAVPAESFTNVHLWKRGDDYPVYDIWTVRYVDEGGFYVIKQLNGEAYLDVLSPANEEGKNVQIWDNPNAENDEKWSIANNGSSYRIQSKASGFCLTVDGGIAEGNNVTVRNANGSNTQNWVFIPIGVAMSSGAGQTIPNGNYLISSATDKRYYLDISGNKLPADAFSNIQVYYNSDIGSIPDDDIWTVRYVDEGGFYVIKQLNGEAYLDVLSPSTQEGQNVQIWGDPDAEFDEKWSIAKSGSNYRIQSKASGFYLTADGGISSGSNVAVRRESGGANQNWIFTPWPLSYTVAYNANGGTSAPSSQIKTGGQTLTLSTTKPTRADSSAGSYKVTFNANGGSVTPTSMDAARTTSYSFKNWNTEANGSGTSYNAGGSYTANAGATLYAQWNSSTTTAKITLPTPTREGYAFKGWATSSSATSGVTGSFTPSENATLYAIWEINSVFLDINGYLDGVVSWNVDNYGTFDVWINGNRVADDRSDFCQAYPVGTTYKIDDIKATTGHIYNGLASDSAALSGTFSTSRINVFLSFATTYDLDLNGVLDGTLYGSLKDYGVADVYINGELKAQGTNDYNKKWPAGTAYEITNIRALDGHLYLGESSIKGTVLDESISVGLPFATIYTIYFDANSGTGAPVSQTKTHGTALTLSTAVPTRTGYSFVGWATNSTATSAQYQPGDSYTADASRTLYAIWKEDTLSINKTAFDYGEPITVTADSARNKAWVGLFKKGESNDSTKWIFWYYVKDHKNTPCDITAWPENNARADKFTPGEYTLALYSDDAGTVLKSFDLTVKRPEPDFVLPASLTTIESEAFAGGSFSSVLIPATVKVIASDAFGDRTELIILGTSGSYAETYAGEKHFTFVPVA